MSGMYLSREKIGKLLKNKVPHEAIVHIFESEGYHPGAVRQVIRFILDKNERERQKIERKEKQQMYKKLEVS